MTSCGRRGRSRRRSGRPHRNRSAIQCLGRRRLAAAEFGKVVDKKYEAAADPHGRMHDPAPIRLRYAANLFGAEGSLVELDSASTGVAHQVRNQTLMACWNRSGRLAQRKPPRSSREMVVFALMMPSLPNSRTTLDKIDSLRQKSWTSASTSAPHLLWTVGPRTRPCRQWRHQRRLVRSAFGPSSRRTVATPGRLRDMEILHPDPGGATNVDESG
jgi:hypothetical protein